MRTWRVWGLNLAIFGALLAPLWAENYVSAGDAAIVAAQPSAAASALRYQDAIIRQGDVAAAEHFLNDQPSQAWLAQNNPEKARDLFEIAAGLADLNEMLQTYPDPDDLRLAIRARPEGTAEALASLAARGGGEPQQRVAAALWNWESLEPSARAYLERNRITPEEWSSYALAKREQSLKDWARAPLHEFYAVVPKTKADLERMRSLINGVSGALEPEDQYRAVQRMRKARVAVEALAQAAERMNDDARPDLRALLHQTQDARDLDRMIDNLNKIFDGLDLPNKEVRMLSPPGLEQTVEPGEQREISRVLQGAVLKEIATTEAGREVVEFYKKHPLRFRVAPGKGGGITLAEFDALEQSITVDQDAISTVLRAERATVKDLMGGGEILERVALLIAPTFVHEATHHRQSVWMEEQGIPLGWYEQEMEIEAHQKEALYAAEKRRQSPRYVKFLSEYAGSDMGQATASLDRAAAGGGTALRRHVSENYSSLASLNAAASIFRLAARHELDYAKRSLGKRGLYAGIDRLKLERRGQSLTEWLARGRSGYLSTSALRVLSRADAKVARFVAALRARYAASAEEFERGMRSLLQ